MNQQPRGEHRYYRGKREINGGNECLMKEDAKYPDQPLDQYVSPKELPDAGGVVRNCPGSKRHSSHEDGEHEGLRVGGMAEEEFEVVRPDGLVNQSGEPGYDEYREQQPPSHEIECLHC
ncbi:MAG: hypothetical protein ACLQFT_19580 [Steroidobacteraceae bacterium]